MLHCVVPFGLRADDAADIKAKLETIRKAGEPTTGEELDKWYPRPAGQNAADILTNAFAKLRLTGLTNSPTLPVLGAGKLPEQDEPLPAAMKEGISLAVKSNREALELLHKGAKIKECRYQIDFNPETRIYMHHMKEVRDAARLLFLEAVLAAEEGKAGNAADSVATIFRLSLTLNNAPTMTSQLVREVCNQFGCDAMQRVLNRLALSEEQLKELAGVIGEAIDRRPLVHALIGERAIGTIDYNQPANRRHDEFEIYHRKPNNGNSGPAGKDWDGNFNDFLDATDKLIKASRENSPEMMTMAKEMMQQANSFKNHTPYYPAEITPLMGRIVKLHLNELADMQCAMLTTGMERYRLAHQNQLAKQLDQLLPSFLDKIPTPAPGRGQFVLLIPSSSEYCITSPEFGENEQAGMLKLGGKGAVGMVINRK